MKSLFEEMGGTYRQEGDYLIPNLALPEEPEYQIGKYGHMRRSYLKEHRPILDVYKRQGIQREKTLKMIPRRYTKTAYLRTADRNGVRSRLWQE